MTRNITYTSMIGCVEMDKTTMKRKKNKDGGAAENYYKYLMHGCGGTKIHKTNRAYNTVFMVLIITLSVRSLYRNIIF